MTPDARTEDFQVVVERSSEAQLLCTHYAEGCWWTMNLGGSGDTLGALLNVAREHLAEAHQRTVDGTVTPPG